MVEDPSPLAVRRSVVKLNSTNIQRPASGVGREYGGLEGAGGERRSPPACFCSRCGRRVEDKSEKGAFRDALHCSDAVTWLRYCSLFVKRPRGGIENPTQLAHPREVQKALAEKGSMYGI